MANINEEYFIPMPMQDKNIPFFNWGKNQDDTPFFKGEPVQNIKSIKLDFGEPKPKKPTIADYHPLPIPVISDKIKDIIDKLNVKNIQFVPVNFKYEQKLDNNYWLLYVNNLSWLSKLIDLEKSKIKLDDNGKIIRVNKILLNDSEINKTPLEDRLIFKLKEHYIHTIMHKSVVNEIIKIKPYGVKFWSLNNWSRKAYFK